MRFTVADLERMRVQPIDDTRYEIIDGELHVSTQPHWRHQRLADQIRLALHRWDPDERRGVVIWAPGVIFAEDEAVAPDLVWVARERFPQVIDDDGKLHAAPDLVVEVLSPGRENERRDRELKLDVYQRRGVREYWIVDWREPAVLVYRRRGAALELVGTLSADDTLTSPLLPGFAARAGELCAQA